MLAAELFEQLQTAAGLERQVHHDKIGLQGQHLLHRDGRTSASPSREISFETDQQLQAATDNRVIVHEEMRVFGFVIMDSVV